MNDRELLELAAEAAGIKDFGYSQNFGGYTSGEPYSKDEYRWNPLQNDGDAFRLAVKLGLSVIQQSSISGPEPVSAASGFGVDDFKRFSCKYDGGPLSATRRSIVLAAAEIARQSKEGKDNG